MRRPFWVMVWVMCVPMMGIAHVFIAATLGTELGLDTGEPTMTTMVFDLIFFFPFALVERLPVCHFGEFGELAELVSAGATYLWYGMIYATAGCWALRALARRKRRRGCADDANTNSDSGRPE